jgi:hypothetical protein
MTENNEIFPDAAVAIKLLQGNVYNDDRESWNCLIQCQLDIKQYFAGIGIDVFIHENDGYAFLKQRKYDEGQEISLPNLVEKRQLSYYVTLLCVLLLEKLMEFDVRGGDSTRLIIDREEIKDSLRMFLPENSNEAKMIDKIDAHINKLIRYGFLRQLDNNENKFEVKRILKAKIPADTLQEIKEKMREHAKLID